MAERRRWFPTWLTPADLARSFLSWSPAAQLAPELQPAIRREEVAQARVRWRGLARADWSAVRHVAVRSAWIPFWSVRDPGLTPPSPASTRPALVPVSQARVQVTRPPGPAAERDLPTAAHGQEPRLYLSKRCFPRLAEDSTVPPRNQRWHLIPARLSYQGNRNHQGRDLTDYSSSLGRSRIRWVWFPEMLPGQSVWGRGTKRPEETARQDRYFFTAEVYRPVALEGSPAGEGGRPGLHRRWVVRVNQRSMLTRRPADREPTGRERRAVWMRAGLANTAAWIERRRPCGLFPCGRREERFVTGERGRFARVQAAFAPRLARCRRADRDGPCGLGCRSPKVVSVRPAVGPRSAAHQGVNPC